MIDGYCFPLQAVEKALVVINEEGKYLLKERLKKATELGLIKVQPTYYDELDEICVITVDFEKYYKNAINKDAKKVEKILDDIAISLRKAVANCYKKWKEDRE